MNTVRDAKLEVIPGPRLHVGKRPMSKAQEQEARELFEERQRFLKEQKEDLEQQ